jgi:hypothetical protein
LSAKGLWWFIEKLNRWNHTAFLHSDKHLNGLDAEPKLALIALLLSIAILEIVKMSNY